MAEHLEQTRLAEALVEDRKTRETAGDTDCVACQARGFETFEEADDDGKPRSAFAWCEICEHSGRVALCRSKSGYWAVRRNRLDEFLAGLLDVHATDVVALGETQPPARYPARA